MTRLKATPDEREIVRRIFVNVTRLIVGIGRAIRMGGDLAVVQAEKCAEEMAETFCDFMDERT